VANEGTQPHRDALCCRYRVVVYDVRVERDASAIRALQSLRSYVNFRGCIGDALFEVVDEVRYISPVYTSTESSFHPNVQLQATFRMA
jgi:hypothetical protein